jgi:hypothetical protein
VTDVTPQELSEYVDLDETNIRKHARGGIMIRAVENGRYVLKSSVRNYIRYLRDIGDRQRSEESMLFKREQRKNIQLKNSVLEGSMVHVEDIQPVWARRVLAVRSSILAIPTIARLRMQLTEAQAVELMEILREQLTAASLTDIPPAIEVGQRRDGN